MTFIEKVVQEIIKEKEHDFSSSVIIFPNRRAGLFFKQALSEHIDRPVWVPKVMSISDFVEKTVPYSIPGDLTLLMELFETYRALGIDEPFDKFYPWGGMLMRDFDEIDKYLLDGDTIFRNLKEIKSLEGRFAFEEDEKNALEEFWGSISNDNPDPYQQAFLDIWEINRQLYTRFRDRLAEKGWGYEGMLYRFLAENPESCDFGAWDHFVFAGFNALSPAEKAFINHFLNKGTGRILWDADQYYLDDPNQEAGAFLRRQFKADFSRPNGQWIENRLSTDKKHVKVFGVPLNVGQAKALGNILANKENDFSSEKTAIILPDEGMLFPVLNALPEGYQDVNVTMGYPLRNTPFYSLFESLIKMQQDAGGGSREKRYYFRSVLNVLLHPFIHPIAPHQIDQRRKAILDNNEIFIPASNLQALGDPDTELFEHLFQPVENLNEVFPYFRQVLMIVQEQVKNTEGKTSPVEQSYLYHFYTYLKRLESLTSQYDIDFHLDTFWSLFRQIIQTQQIPFNGEPLKGLQVMGTLETRNLDFENVFVLSANEGQMPPSANSNSYIPFNLRKAFGLPTYEEEDSLFAYHFYRILQRASNIYFFYDTEMSSLQKGEKSRFVYQLENEWANTNPNVVWQEYLLKAPLSTEVELPIEVPKGDNVWKSLSKYLDSGDGNKQSALSPSAILTYMDCPLQFYFKYVAGLEEEEEVTEEIRPDTLGSIFHDAIAKLYEMHIEENGSEVTEESLKALHDKIDEALDHGFKKNFSSDLENLQGRNLLIRSIIARQLASVLERDSQEVPFNLLLVEKGHYEASFPVEINQDKYQVWLIGIIDRLDEKDGIKRVLDYKTGKIHYNKSQGVPDFFTNSGNKTAFQLMWYGYVYNRNFPKDAIKLGAYPLKEMNQPVNFLFKGNTLDEDSIGYFEEGLKEQLNSLFDPDIPFKQTTDRKVCEQCPYNKICHRQD